MKISFKNTTQAIVFTGMLAALLVVLSQISIPLPTGVPITLQTFGVALCGYLLGKKCGTLSVLVYLALGVVGLPVFAGFSGGFGVVLGMTGGFLWGFLPMAFGCGFGMSLKGKFFPVLPGLCGLVICHLFGALQFSLVSGTAFWQSLLIVSVPYLVKDVISVVLAFAVSIALLTGMKKANLLKVAA